jgi:hypothetical protein
MLNGFVAPVYQSGSGPVNDVSLVAGLWNDFNPAHQNAPGYNELDAFGEGSSRCPRFINI